ncbi:MAG: hypothetical protein ACT4QC_21610 [Planctomycetaceae bacterium]
MQRVRISLGILPVRLALVLGMAAFAGCESPAWVRSLNDAFTMRRAENALAQQESHRREYVASHSRQSMRWLLGHCVNTGMPYKEVCRALGEDGARESHDTWIKTRGGPYQVGDEVYAFGPDNEGQSVYLVFRDDQLIGFDPDEFRKEAKK